MDMHNSTTIQPSCAAASFIAISSVAISSTFAMSSAGLFLRPLSVALPVPASIALRLLACFCSNNYSQSKSMTLPKLIMRAAENGKLAKVTAWVHSGGDVNATYERVHQSQCVVGYTMLMAASGYGHALLVHTLLEARASGNKQNSYAVRSRCPRPRALRAATFERGRSA